MQKRWDGFIGMHILNRSGVCFNTPVPYALLFRIELYGSVVEMEEKIKNHFTSSGQIIAIIDPIPMQTSIGLSPALT